MKHYADDALKFGSDAFHAGKMRVPALDADFMRFLKGKPNILSLLTAWLKGWDKENLAQPVNLD